jgi:hypothetical protein
MPLSDPDWAALGREVVLADHCHALAIREGIEDACGKPPVAIIDARDLDDGGYWPACAYHAHRYGRGRCVPLSDLYYAVAGKAFYSER